MHKLFFLCLNNAAKNFKLLWQNLSGFIAQSKESAYWQNYDCGSLSCLESICNAVGD